MGGGALVWYMAREGRFLPRAGYAALAALGCVLMGLSWAASLSRRVQALRAWGRVLSRLEAGLSYRPHTLEAFVAQAAQGEENRDVSAHIAACVTRMRETPLLSLKEAMEPVAMPELTPSDKAALALLFQGLGEGDEQAQRGLLAAVRMAVAAQMEEAAQQEGKDRRLATSLGFIGGGAVFLFLL